MINPNLFSNFLIKKLPLLILIISLLAHGYFSQLPIMFGDEIISIFVANSRSFSNLLSGSVEIIHPNLYYILLKGILLIFNSIYVARFIHYFIFLLDVIVLYKIGRSFSLKKQEIILFLLPFSTSLYFFKFTYTLRMYSIAILFLLFSIYFLLQYSQKQNWKYLFFSLLADILGIFSVYGYLLWLPIKIAILIKGAAERKEAKINLWVLASMSTFISSTFIIFKSYLANKSIFNVYLNWVKIPFFEDLGISFISLNGGGLFTYFEDADSLSPGLKLIGTFFSIVLLLCIPISIWRLKKIITNTHIKLGLFFGITEFIFWLVLIELIGFFSLTSFFGLTFFHIRQLFVVALLFSMFFGVLLVKIRERISILIVVVLFCFSLANIGQVPYSPYSRPFQKNIDWVLATPGDMELAYYYCEADSFEEIIEKCPAHKIYFDFDELKNNMYDTSEFYVTDSNLAKLPLSEVRCEDSIDNINKCKLLINIRFCF